MPPITVSRIMILIAVVCFILAAFGVSTSVGLVPLGLAIWAASGLVG